MNLTAPLAIVGLLFLAGKRRAPALPPPPLPEEPPPPPVRGPKFSTVDTSPGGIVVTPGDLYYVAQPGDTPVDLARHWTGDPMRWRELRDVQPSKRRRAQLSAGIIQPGSRLLLPSSWQLPDDVPNEHVELLDQAVLADPLVASAGP